MPRLTLRRHGHRRTVTPIAPNPPAPLLNSDDLRPASPVAMLLVISYLIGCVAFIVWGASLLLVTE